MIKICFVLGNTFLVTKGGAELQAYNIAKALSKKEYEVHYIHQNDWEERIKKDGIMWYALPQIPRKFSIAILNNPTFVELLDEINPDIIYQRIRSVYTGMVAKYCNKRNVKFVWAASSEADCGDKKRDSIKRIIQWYGNIRLGEWGIKQADEIIVQTKKQKDMLYRNFGLNSQIIPNSQNVPRRPFEKDEPPKVVWIANMKFLKQPEYFVKLARELSDLDVKFIMVGRLKPLKGYKKKIHELIKSTQNIDYRGELPYDEVNKLLEKASIFVNTSLPREGFPNTFIQSWMRETPVVSLYFDPDNIMERENIGIRTGSMDMLKKEIKDLLQNGKRRKEMAKNGRKYAVKNHDIVKNIKIYDEFFKGILKE